MVPPQYSFRFSATPCAALSAVANMLYSDGRFCRVSAADAHATASGIELARAELQLSAQITTPQLDAAATGETRLEWTGGASARPPEPAGRGGGFDAGYRMWWHPLAPDSSRTLYSML